MNTVRVVETGAKRNASAGKGRFDLLPPRAVLAVARHFENGGSRFGDRNWEKGMPLSWFFDSAMRHGFAALEGQMDEDHAVAAAWNWLCFVETRARIQAGLLPAELDDLPKPVELPAEDKPAHAGNGQSGTCVYVNGELGVPSQVP